MYICFTTYYVCFPINCMKHSSLFNLMPSYKRYLPCYLLFTCFNTPFLSVCFFFCMLCWVSAPLLLFSSPALTILLTQPFTCTIVHQPCRSLSWSFTHLQGLNLFDKFFCVLIFLAIFFLFWFAVFWSFHRLELFESPMIQKRFE